VSRNRRAKHKGVTRPVEGRLRPEEVIVMRRRGLLRYGDAAALGVGKGAVELHGSLRLGPARISDVELSAVTAI
jgi:hypothetical protein